MLNHKIVLFVFAGIMIVSCKKDWIEVKSNKALDVPTSVEDFQALLDNSAIMNDVHPSLGEVSADNYYLPNNIWQVWASHNRNAYIWSNDVYNNTNTDNVNWNYSYRQVFYANVVLDGINEVEAAFINTPAWNNVKGSALYYRADAFLNVSQLFTKPYSLTSPDLPGIPLRLSADPNAASARAGLQETYQQMLNDLHGAVQYLPDLPLYKTRPSKTSAYALLARVYLVMHDYPKSLLYADSCLKLYDSLLDYNSLKTNVTYPIPGLNKEVIFQATISDDLQATMNCIVDSNLYKSYNVNDLRKQLFYKVNTAGQASFIGTYTGGTVGNASKAFGGIATDEIYLIRAECYARSGNTVAAMNDLNSLMSKRWKAGTFVPFTASNATEALTLILQERRKETPFRGLRWVDLRRLNSEGANITLVRNANGQQYTIAPNDPRYVLPIPPDVISLSGMAQNER
ncbi:RagB/SusD family nutrient uptake outer membrane protein [Niastella caeni]|uniref:RagB/SusD family nutrient uptake outer membrane protein n=1 Tax=Niastella caeni TaxID=2569763 RepID=A0A4S8HXB7_9BACT|nr:RagB/SusD family nutrient uptake outer membrane protein [Niastella caeni]THU40290.1 RagB/SusD family nutrient uptake outer membrane protein [Niastella caeni]